MTTHRRHLAYLLLIFAIGWAVRLLLALQGGCLFYPDEWRYFAGVRMLHALAGGQGVESVRILMEAGGHAGFAIASLPPLVAQGVLRVFTGLHPEETLVIAQIWLTFLSALLPLAVYALARRRGAETGEALAAALFCMASTSMIRYSRHLFPYDASLLALLAGAWLACKRDARGPLLTAGGMVAGFGLWVYNGHWAACLTLCLFVALQQWCAAGTPVRRIARIACFAGGLLVVPLLNALLSELTDAGLGDKLVRHSGSMVGGTPSEGWWIPWAYFARSEGLMLPLLAGGALLTLRRGGRSGRWAALAALTLYLLLVVSSNGIGLWPVFGRHARSLLPLLCIAAAAGWVGALRERPRGRAALALLAAAASAWNYATPLRERFPTDLLPGLLREHPGDVRVFAENVGQMQPFAEPELLDPRARYVFTNPYVPKPVGGHLPPPAGRVLWSIPHPSQLPYNHYNGYLAHERDWLRREDFSVKWIDTRPEAGQE